MPAADTPSALAVNKALFQRFVDSWNARDMDQMSACWDPAMIHHDRARDCGPSEVFELMGSFMAAFPDLRFEIHDLIADGEMVAARMTARASQQGSFMGLTPTGRSIAVTVMGQVRVVQGRIVEHWNLMDEVHLMQQLGVASGTFFDAVPDAH